MNYKSFIDVLFILLLSAMVMLTQSVQLGAVDTVLAELGAGGVSPISADDVQIVVVSDDELRLNDRSFAAAEEIAGSLRAGDPVLLVTADAEVRHHRVLGVWSALRHQGLDVKLGAKPRPAAKEGG